MTDSALPTYHELQGRVAGLAAANTLRRSPAYCYLFDWKLPAVGGALGAHHALDVMVMSGTYKLFPEAAGNGPVAVDLADTMMDAWAAFARDGDPSTSAVTWPRFDPAELRMVVLGPERHVVSKYREAELRAWDGIIP